MKNIKFSFKNSMLEESYLAQDVRKLKTEIENMNLAAQKNYEDDRASINLAINKYALEKVNKIVEEKKKLNPQYLLLLGIGGSNLGTMAVQEAVLSKFYNQVTKEIKILYSDTVDSDSMQKIIQIIEPVLKKGGNIIINVISKSGETTETMANFKILYNIISSYKKNPKKYIVVTSDWNSNLWQFANEQGFSVLEIPKKIGGRYSVLSSVGLFPLALLGIDIAELLNGAAFMRKKCLNKNIRANPAALSAAIQYFHYKKGRNISDLFLFSNDLESFGKWYRQLMAESIAKEFNIKKRRINVGITPTVSIGSTDLHSMAQLYLGGPQDKFTTFVKIKKNNSKLKVPRKMEFLNLDRGIAGKSLDKIMNSILSGIQIAFKKGRRPFIEIELQDKSENSIGQFLQFKMMEIIYLGALMEINPFNQPNVEAYKSETRKILGIQK